MISAVAVLLIVLGIVGKKQGWWGQTDEELAVEVGKVESQTIIETVSASGRIQPAVEVKISPEVSGEIIELRVVEGQYVRKGTLLARINPDLYQSSVGRAEALVNQSKSGLLQSKAQFVEVQAAYLRSKGLFEQNVLSKAEWESAQRAQQVAELTVKSAESTRQPQTHELNCANGRHGYRAQRGTRRARCGNGANGGNGTYADFGLDPYGGSGRSQ
ncbi:MAG: hypothetical protein RL558_1079 [Bacteroidota bacterium]